MKKKDAEGSASGATTRPEGKKSSTKAPAKATAKAADKKPTGSAKATGKKPTGSAKASPGKTPPKKAASAKQAADWGMIWEAVADDTFSAHWQGRAAALAAGPSVAYRAVKAALRKSFVNDLAGQLALEARLQGTCGKTADFLEGVSAFLEKRPAKFKGR